MRKLTTEDFVRRAVKIYGEKYDYTNVVYVNNRTLVKICCSIHGTFTQTPHTHLQGHGCPICGRLEGDEGRTLTQQEFIQRCKEVHGDKYDYSKAIYIHNNIPIDIICRSHGIFQQKPVNHLTGRGCRSCGRETQGYKCLTQQEFLQRATEIHGDRYDYSKVDYKHSKAKIEIVCPIHSKSFFPTPNCHLNGSGCPECGNKKKSNERFITQLEFLRQCGKIHGDRYDYSKTIYGGSHIPIEIICKKCKKSFWQAPNNHISGKNGCPRCRRSKGELLVEDFLEKRGTIYINEMRFDDCLGLKNRPLPYDFFLPNYNILIEVDGLQHYKEGIGKMMFGSHKVSQKDYERVKRNDEIKTLYALQNKIRLVRIPYRNKTDTKNIIPILEKEII
jgi:hypothetical protein